MGLHGSLATTTNVLLFLHLHLAVVTEWWMQVRHATMEIPKAEMAAAPLAMLSIAEMVYWEGMSNAMTEMHKMETDAIHPVMLNPDGTVQPNPVNPSVVIGWLSAESNATTATLKTETEAAQRASLNHNALIAAMGCLISATGSSAMGLLRAATT